MKQSHNTFGKWAIVVFLFFLFSISNGITFAETPRIIIPSSINPVGSGARALGMGGAFISIADDATAASWNPGGLIQLETPEVSIVGTYFQREEDNTFDVSPVSSGKQDISNRNLNYLSATFPFTALNRNMIVSVNYQVLYEFSREWDLSISTTQANNTTRDADLEYDEEGIIGAIGMAYCIQATPRLSFGFTLNFWGDGIYNNGWEQSYKETGAGLINGNPYTFSNEQNEKYEFEGFNANLGFLWALNSRLSIGAVLKTPFTANINHEIDEESETGTGTIDFESDEDKELDMPKSYGIGFSYRFSDRMTGAIDVYHTEWDEYILKDDDGNEISPINNKPVDEADIDPTTQLRTGFEYLFIGSTYVVPVRSGLFYDPAPAEGSTDDYYGFSLGSGLVRGKVVCDIAYQFRFGNDVGKHLYESLDFSQDVREHTLFASLIYHF